VWVARGGYVYQVAGTSLEKDWPRYREPFEAFVASFRPLTPRDRERVREARVRIVDAKPGETLAKLVARSGSAWSVERAAAANAVPSVDATLGSGDPVKVARWETYRGDAE
jgi:predicted Zn-dependent protease